MRTDFTLRSQSLPIDRAIIQCSAMLVMVLAYTQAHSASEEIRSTLADQKDVSITIYNNDLALVKDQRKVNLRNNFNALAIRDVSAMMRPETAILRSISHPGSFSLLEQNFNFDLLNPQSLLEKSVGKSVSIIKTNPATGAETHETAEILSADNGVVLKIGDRIETGMPGRMVFNTLPENLRDRPTLVAQIDNKNAGEQTVELSYLTGGLSWKADYVAELNATEDKLDLSGWVTLNNTSGTRYRDAHLQLVAGDVNHVKETLITPYTKRMAMTPLADAAPAPMAEEGLLDYHLYSLARPTTIAENQTKQVALLSATGITVKKSLILQGADYYYQSPNSNLGQKLKPSIYLDFDNKEANKLGLALPKGIMRVYKRDSHEQAQFVGEDQIAHTAKNEALHLKLGEAFDVTVDKKQTDFKKLPLSSKGMPVYESAYSLLIQNAKKEAVTITIQEPMNGDWKIISENHPHIKKDSQLAEWKINIPAEASTQLDYRVVVKY